MSAFDPTGYQPIAASSAPVSGEWTAITDSWVFGTITREVIVDVTGVFTPIVNTWTYGGIASTNGVQGAFTPIADTWNYGAVTSTLGLFGDFTPITKNWNYGAILYSDGTIPNLTLTTYPPAKIKVRLAVADFYTDNDYPDSLWHLYLASPVDNTQTNYPSRAYWYENILVKNPTLMALQCLIETLKAHKPLYDLVGNKMYWMKAPDKTALPYIVVNRIEGGETNDMYQSRDYTACWRVYAHTLRANDVPDYMDAIYQALVGKTPIVPVGVVAAALGEIEEELPYHETYLLQNNVVYVVGGEYKFSLSIMSFKE